MQRMYAKTMVSSFDNDGMYAQVHIQRKLYQT